MTEDTKIVMITDILEQKLRKEKELEFYERELKKLQTKMFWVKKEIDLTNTIIRVIQEDRIIDLKDNAEKNLLIGDNDD